MITKEDTKTVIDAYESIDVNDPKSLAKLYPAGNYVFAAFREYKTKITESLKENVQETVQAIRSHISEIEKESDKNMMTTIHFMEMWLSLEFPEYFNN